MQTYVIKESSGMTDLYRTDERYERELQNIREWTILEKDKLLFTEFLYSMQARGIGYVQLLKYIQGMKSFLKSYNKSYNELTRQDLERFLIDMQQSSLKPKTQKIRWYSVKKFFDFIDCGSCFFPVRFLKSRHKLPEEILTEEEVDAMVDAIDGLQAQCFIAVLYESGCRIGEIMMLRKKDIIFDENGAILIADGKTGQRRVRIIKYARLLKQLDVGSNSISRIFDFSWYMAKKILHSAAEKASIHKRVYPHLFRHSRATHLAQVLTDQQLKQFFGWTRSSEMAAIYVHLSGRDIDQAIIKHHRECETQFDRLKKMGVG